MSVAVFPLGPLETNCYLVSYEGQAVAIDVGGDPAPVSKYLKEHGRCRFSCRNARYGLYAGKR